VGYCIKTTSREKEEEIRRSTVWISALHVHKYDIVADVAFQYPNSCSLRKPSLMLEDGTCDGDPWRCTRTRGAILQPLSLRAPSPRAPPNSITRCPLGHGTVPPKFGGVALSFNASMRAIKESPIAALVEEGYLPEGFSLFQPPGHSDPIIRQERT
jgi:hypothetical protein